MIFKIKFLHLNYIVKKILLICILFACISKTYSFDFSRDELICSIQAGYELNEKGELKKIIEITNWNWIKETIKQFFGVESNEIPSIKHTLLNQKFSVNRKTGILIGSYFNSKILKNDVIDPGSKEQSIKIISTPQFGFMEVQYLRIDLYVQSNKKPMFLTDSSNVFSGICEQKKELK